LIKWFLKTIGIEGIARLAEKLGNNKAVAKCVIGYSDGKATRFFEGSVRGKIVSPRKKSSFGWDPIFQPDCYRKTFEDMTKEEKNKISHRGIAFSRLEKFLKKN
jgi:non-canonical purine NTP pyrophosphatase (RdgB/HAM1 family)